MKLFPLSCNHYGYNLRMKNCSPPASSLCLNLLGKDGYEFLHGDVGQNAFHCFLRSRQQQLENRLNVSADLALRVRLIMDMEQLALLDNIHRAIDIQKRNLVQASRQTSTAAPRLNRRKPRLLKLPQNSPDNNRISPNASGNPLRSIMSAWRNCKQRQHVYRYSKTAADFHAQHPFVVIIIVTTQGECQDLEDGGLWIPVRQIAIAYSRTANEGRNSLAGCCEGVLLRLFIRYPALRATRHFFGLRCPARRAPRHFFGLCYPARQASRHFFGLRYPARRAPRHFFGLRSTARRASRHFFGLRYPAWRTLRHFLGLRSHARRASRHFFGLRSPAKRASRHFLGLRYPARRTLRHFFGLRYPARRAPRHFFGLRSPARRAPRHFFGLPPSSRTAR